MRSSYVPSCVMSASRVAASASRQELPPAWLYASTDVLSSQEVLHHNNQQSWQCEHAQCGCASLLRRMLYPATLLTCQTPLQPEEALDVFAGRDTRRINCQHMGRGIQV